MKAKKLVYHAEECFFSTPRVIYGKIISEDDQFLNFLTGAGKTYRISKNCIVSLEDSNKEFELQEASHESCD